LKQLAFTGSRSEAEANVDMTLSWLRRHLRPSAVISLMETLPAHFPQRPFGEYEYAFHARMPREQRRCVAYDPALDAHDPAANFRADVPREMAALHGLPLFRTWALAAASHDDHSIDTPKLLGVDKMIGTFDCRHYCNPGRTMLAVADAFAAFLPYASPASAPPNSNGKRYTLPWGASGVGTSK
jgi:hypothetical protein